MLIGNKFDREELCLFRSGERRWQKLYYAGDLHNSAGPAITRWTRKGNVWSEEYYNRAARHREDGPAVRVWSQGDVPSLREEAYFLHGRRHRVDGPAVLIKDRGRCSYFLYDVELSYSRFMQLAVLPEFEQLAFVCRGGKFPMSAWKISKLAFDDLTALQLACAVYSDYLRSARDDVDYLSRLARATQGYPKVLDILGSKSEIFSRSVQASILLCA